VPCRGAPKGGRDLPGCGHPTTNSPKPKFKKNTDFVGIIIYKVLRDLPFSRNQPLNSADEWYIRILKNKLIKLKKKQEDGTLLFSHGTCGYILMYINAVADNVMLYLQHTNYVYPQGQRSYCIFY
jgi:hypothetical protein